jgi:hypothetical protein
MCRTATDILSTTRTTKDTEQSSHWAIVYLGIGKSNKEEYHILNRATGTYLSTTCKSFAQMHQLCTITDRLQRPPKTKTTSPAT